MTHSRRTDSDHVLRLLLVSPGAAPDFDFCIAYGAQRAAPTLKPFRFLRELWASRFFTTKIR